MYQASRVRFRFDDEALEVLIGKSEDKTENAFVGGVLASSLHIICAMLLSSLPVKRACSPACPYSPSSLSLPFILGLSPAPAKSSSMFV